MYHSIFKDAYTEKGTSRKNVLLTAPVFGAVFCFYDKVKVTFLLFMLIRCLIFVKVKVTNYSFGGVLPNGFSLR